MDFSLLIGFIAGIALMVYGVISSNADITIFIHVPSAIITFGGTIAAIIMSIPFSTIRKIPSHLKVIFKRDKRSLEDYIDIIFELATEARIRGLLSLEDKIKEMDVQDDFLTFCVMLVVDAMDANKIKSNIENEIDCMEERHSQVWELYDKGAAFGPAFGMIGTLIGLISMLKGLSAEEGSANSAKQLGDGMSTALITTLYGSFIANLLFVPMSTKLRARHEEEVIKKELIKEGVLAIQSGGNPKYIKENLMTYLKQNDRTEEGPEGEDGEGEGKKKKKKGKKKKAGGAAE